MAITTTSPALTVAYCHCADCRRWTGAPMPAFAAFDDARIAITPDVPEFSYAKGVMRRVCPDCGSPLTARFDYLPGQTYVPIGILDQAGDLAPQMHCHVDSALPWVPLHDGLPTTAGSARTALGSQTK